MSVYIAQYPPLWIVLRAFKVALNKPWGIAGLAFIFGYARAAARRVDRLGDEELRRFIRAELRGRMRKAFRVG